MGMQAAQAVGEYTEQILNDNFTNVAKAFKAADVRMNGLENGLHHLSDHIAELYDMVKETGATQVVAKSSRLKPFLVGAAVGVAVYSYSKKNKRKIEQIQRDAKEKIEEFVNSQRQAQTAPTS
jgi:hypothetical protein